MISNDAAREMIATLESDAIDDAEELLIWFGENGADILTELLLLRATMLDVAFTATRTMIPGTATYNREVMTAIEKGLNAVALTI